MDLIDSHAHLTFPELSGRIDDLLGQCDQAGVNRVITVGVHLDDARAAVDLAERYPGRIHVAAGFHPHEAGDVSKDDLEAMATLWDHPSVVAAGEIGLDYHYDHADRADQRRVFARQLELAVDRGYPVVIHSREAFDDTVAILLKHGLAHHRVAFHCFSGTAEQAARLVEHGWWVSFTGIVTFRKSETLWEAARSYPADRVMIETDSPFLSPEPVRHIRPNVPAHVVHTARFLADLRGISPEDLGDLTTANTQRFFNL